MAPNKHPPDNKHMSYLVWFPAMRKDIVTRIKNRYKQPVIEMTGRGPYTFQLNLSRFCHRVATETQPNSSLSVLTLRAK